MTRTLPDVDPRRTHALLVGIEQYEAGLQPLPGAAADALGHARWLMDNGVPADHIRLCVSPLDSNREHVRSEAERLGITHCRTAGETDVRDVLQKQLRGLTADLLWFSWSGHGVQAPDGQGELLPFADGAMALPTTSVRDFLLHNPANDGIARKVLLIDACRLFRAQAHSYGQIQFPGTVHRPRPRTELLMLKATQSGSVAYSDPSGGLFTRTLLRELRDTQGWPPDPADLADAIAAVLRADGRQALARPDDEHWTGARFRPAPLANRPESLRTHQEALTRLGAKGKFLTDTRLPYLPPAPGHETAPDRILARLTHSSDSTGYHDPLRGVLLTGPAGTGKTRTCLEVAQLALDRNWQVFHPRQDNGLDAEQLLDGIREAITHTPDSPVLLVLDYLDRYHSLDLRVLADHLHTEAEHGLRVACVASVRPGALKDLRNRGYRSLFAVVELRSDKTRQHDLAEHIFHTVALKARTTLGYDKMAELCTTHPVLALLLALELERLADDGTLDPEAADVPRPGALVDWFDRRTHEDLGPTSDPAELLAATAAALTCVHTRDAVEQAADTVLRHHPGTTTGAHVVNRLTAHGWLLTAEDPDTPGTEDTLDTIHDIVTDLFLDETCLPDGYTLDPDTPGELLDALHGDLHTLRRAVGHLNRWGTDLKGRATDDLARACSAWLKNHRTDVLALLRQSPHDGTRTLVAMISAAPWRQAVVTHWNTLVTPWLDGAEPERIRAFLTDAALNCGEAPTELLEAAHDWLTQHTATDPGAIHLINALAHTGIDPDDRTDHYEQYVAAHALAWLEHHGLSRASRGRIHTVLNHTGHSPAVAARAAHAAVELAYELRHEFATERLLTTLLRNAHIPPADRFRLANATHDWMARYGTHEVTSYIYTAALNSPLLPDATPVASFALEWLLYHGDKPVASFVLRALLKAGLSPLIARQAVTRARTWLGDEKNARDPDASFVLAPLLHETNLQAAPDQAAAGAAAALAWLRRHPLLPETSYVLINLLKYQDNATADPDRATVTATALTAALNWLDTHDTWDRQLLSALLARRHEMTQEQRIQAADAALTRMSDTPRTEPADSYVLSRLLLINELPETQLDDALRHALSWIDAHLDSPAASSVLASYLLCAHRGDRADALESGIDRALRWLGQHGATEEAGYVLEKLRPARHNATAGLDTSAVEHLVARHTLNWALTWPAHDSSTRLLVQAVRRPDDLGDDGRDQTLDAVRAWLAVRHRTPETEASENAVLNALLLSGPMDGDMEKDIVLFARNRLDLDHPAPSDDRVLRVLLYRCVRTETLDPEVIRATLDWLEAYAPTKTDDKLLGGLLRLRQTSPDTQREAVRHTMNWLRSPHGAGQPGSYVLESLIVALKDMPPPHPDVLPVALAWLRVNGYRAAAKYLLRALADYAPAIHRPEIQAHADRWLAAHPDATDDIQTYLTAYLPPA
ncbi:caspase family protein [Streptomyces sp. NPDC002088]|uniref:caspase family protein n=1 Tax=Streptomyces sp. NPDC002088 TaxID=3154665 RepID=UPI00332C21C5